MGKGFTGWMITCLLLKWHLALWVTQLFWEQFGIDTKKDRLTYAHMIHPENNKNKTVLSIHSVTFRVI